MQQDIETTRAALAQRQQEVDSLRNQTQTAAKQLSETILSKEERRKELEASLADQKASAAELKSHVGSLRESKAANEREKEEVSSEYE